MSDTIVVIPVRMKASRLPNKPLADIYGKPMVLRVIEQAMKANIGDVLVAAGDQEIVDVVKNYGYDAVLTDPSLQSGSDRVHAAVSQIKSNHKFVINAQGDQPLLSPESLVSINDFLCKDDKFDIVTLACKCTKEEAISQSIAKVVFNNKMEAMYFSRALFPYGEGDYYHHIGLYGFKREALDKYVSLPPSSLEIRESLEQLRALENGMKVGIAIVGKQQPEVNTPEDLELVRQIIESKGY
jgi:3-deoxy-manno-octulosonate cytidylyltransferase (CMP-KDO synthetase)